MQFHVWDLSLGSLFCALRWIQMCLQTFSELLRIFLLYILQLWGNVSDLKHFVFYFLFTLSFLHMKYLIIKVFMKYAWSKASYEVFCCNIKYFIFQWIEKLIEIKSWLKSTMSVLFNLQLHCFCSVSPIWFFSTSGTGAHWEGL